MLQLYNWLEFAFAENDILQEECSKDKQMLSINIEIQKKLAMTWRLQSGEFKN